MCILTLTEIPIRPKAIRQWSDVLIDVLLFNELREYIHTLLDLLLHEKGTAISEKLDLLKNLLIDVQRLSSLQSVTCAVEVAHLDLDFGYFVNGLCHGLLGTIMFDGLFVTEDGVIKVTSIVEDESTEKVSF